MLKLFVTTLGAAHLLRNGFGAEALINHNSLASSSQSDDAYDSLGFRKDGPGLDGSFAEISQLLINDRNIDSDEVKEDAKQECASEESDAKMANNPLQSEADLKFQAWLKKQSESGPKVQPFKGSEAEKAEWRDFLTSLNGKSGIEVQPFEGSEAEKAEWREFLTSLNGRWSPPGIEEKGLQLQSLHLTPLDKAEIYVRSVLYGVSQGIQFSILGTIPGWLFGSFAGACHYPQPDSRAIESAFIHSNTIRAAGTGAALTGIAIGSQRFFESVTEGITKGFEEGPKAIQPFQLIV